MTFTSDPMSKTEKIEYVKKHFPELYNNMIRKYPSLQEIEKADPTAIIFYNSYIMYLRDLKKDESLVKLLFINDSKEK